MTQRYLFCYVWSRHGRLLSVGQGRAIFKSVSFIHGGLRFAVCKIRVKLKNNAVSHVDYHANRRYVFSR